MDKIYWIKLQKKILFKTAYIKHIIKKYLIYVKYIKKLQMNHTNLTYKKIY